MRDYLTLSQSNQFKFVCPIFNVETAFRQCAKLRDIVYRGGRPPVRRGCQACIQSSKCPAAEVIRKIAFSNGKAADDHASETPVMGKLAGEILERVAPVVVLEKTMNECGVPPAERALIADANPRIIAQLGHAPRNRSDAHQSATKRRKRATPPAPANTNTKINEAAATGDLAAAVSA